MTSPLPATAAAICAALGLALAAASPLLPAPWSIPVGLLGLLLAGLGGAAVKPPTMTDGKPLLQGGALALATGALGLLSQLYGAIPAGWPQSIALVGAGAVAWLSGKALPPLGAPSHEALEAAKTAGATAALDVASKADAVAAIKAVP